MKKILIILFLFSSCTKLKYVIEQGQGQLSLLHKAKSNEELLQDVKVSSKDKERIIYIQKLKEYFYDYFSLPKTSIYSKTTILDRDAVTYLVIASPHNKIEAKNHCFPFVGCFPYLGFFSVESAREFRNELERGPYVTFQRPVYAYSTTGYFTDPILSSFFKYNDFDLAELVFHELFHTIFFVKNEVELNENLANYFGRELALEYFKKDEDFKIKREAEEEKINVLKQYIVKSTQKLQKIYKEKLPETKAQSSQILEQFIRGEFIPGAKKICAEQNLERCFALERKWNNASFSAYLTYERNSKNIENLHKKLNLSLLDYFNYIKMAYQKYEGEDFSQDFFNR